MNNRLDARYKILVLVLIVVGIGLLIYFGNHWISRHPPTLSGPTQVAPAPRGLVSMPGAQMTPEYQHAVEQANLARAQQAQMTGGSAVPTMINYGSPRPGGGGIYAEQTPNVKNLLDKWLMQGKIAPDVSSDLQGFANQNVTEAEYAGKLTELIKQGKLTPEQARQLLEEYSKQHAARQLSDSAVLMDTLIKSGQLSLRAANELLRVQKNNVSPAEYAEILQRLAKDGKISSIAQLQIQYTQQRAKEIISDSIAILQDMSRSGQIMPDVLKDLIELETKMVPVDAFSTVLHNHVKAGRLTSGVAAKILDEYKSQKSAIGPKPTIAKLLTPAEKAALKIGGSDAF